MAKVIHAKRKRWLVPAVIFSWLCVGTIIFVFPPHTTAILMLLIICMFSAVASLGSLLLTSVRRALLVATGVSIMLVLRIMALDTLLSTLLLIGLLVSVEVYWMQKTT